MEYLIGYILFLIVLLLTGTKTTPDSMNAKYNYWGTNLEGEINRYYSSGVKGYNLNHIFFACGFSRYK